jgi:hypothetical protein
VTAATAIRAPAVHYVLFGAGNVPWTAYTLIRRADVPDGRKPPVGVV